MFHHQRSQIFRELQFLCERVRRQIEQSFELRPNGNEKERKCGTVQLHCTIRLCKSLLLGRDRRDCLSEFFCLTGKKEKIVSDEITLVSMLSNGSGLGRR